MAPLHPQVFNHLRKGVVLVESGVVAGDTQGCKGRQCAASMLNLFVVLMWAAGNRINRT